MISKEVGFNFLSVVLVSLSGGYYSLTQVLVLEAPSGHVWL